MTLIVIDVEMIENNIVKELGLYVDGIVRGYSFQPPKGFQPTHQSFWCTRHLHGINWTCGSLEYEELWSVLHHIKSHNGNYFAKGRQKCRLLSAVLQRNVENLDDYGCPKIHTLAFRNDDDSLDYVCSSYPIQHNTRLYCAERKAFVFGTWAACKFL